MEIYSYPGNPRVLKSLVASSYCGVHIDVLPIEMGVTNKTPEFLKMNPNGQVPTMKTPKGAVWESNSIARYVARLNLAAGLYGDTAIQAANIDGWLDWCLTKLDPQIAIWLYPILGYGLYNKNNENGAKQKIKDAMLVLDGHLLSRTYLVNDQVTLADICVACTLVSCYKLLFDPSFRSAFPNVNRWFMTIINQPEFIQHEKIILCEKMSVYTPPKKEEKPKEEKPKEVKPTKKEEKKENVEEDELPKEKKPKNPLDLLPKATMDLDNWKRTYSNYKEEDFYGVMKLFYEQYVPQDYSLWICDYKFDEENTVSFKTSNLVGGFIQRSDELRKYAFGNMLMLKKEGGSHFHLKGAWMIRGSEIKPMLEANPDAEYYNWTPVNLSDEASKKLFEHYWCASEKIDDFNVVETICFK